MNLLEQIQFHRYRYYVMDDPMISDYEYDVLERRARDQYGDDAVGIGSSLRSSYPESIRTRAEAGDSHS